MSADALSDVLRTVRLTGATFFDVVATAPWVAEQPPREMILRKILPGAEHLVARKKTASNHEGEPLVSAAENGSSVPSGGRVIARRANENWG
jgi:hypothetical protein